VYVRCLTRNRAGRVVVLCPLFQSVNSAKSMYHGFVIIASKWRR